MRRKFATLDVFTDTRLAGNQLAIVLEADGLEKPDMQAIAREFNLAETVFLLPPGDTNNRARLRIFTPAVEIPFAGHPTVGTAVLLGCMSGGTGKRDMVLEEPIGLVRCSVEPQGHQGGHASFEVPRLPEETAPAPDSATIAVALHLSAADIGFANFRPGCWSAGNNFTFVPVSGLDAVARAAPDMSRFEAAFGGKSPGMVYVFCAETSARENNFHARMFAPGMGVPEDPATGSAAAAFAGLLASSGECGNGRHQVRIEQGYEMGRPSLIEIDLTIEGGALTQAAIGGNAVLVSEGAIEV